MNASVPAAGTAVLLRLDRSRAFSTVHGERAPDDPHAGIHFYQDGLPFDAQEVYVPDQLNDKNDRDGKLRAMVERRLRKLEGVATPADAEAEAAASDPPLPGAKPNAAEADDMNLVAWARGEAQYLFGNVREAIRKRYSQVVKDQRGAVECLLDEKAVTEADLSPAFKQLLDIKD